MAFNITIDRNSLDGSEQSYSDEEEFSDEEASPVVSDEEELDEEPGNNWTLTFPDEEEVKPSDSASRPRTSRRNRNPIRGSRSVSSSRRPSRRRIVQGRNSYPHRPRHYSPESPESVDSSEEYEGPCVSTPEGRLWQQPIMPGQVPPYNNTYPHGVAPHGPFMHPSGPYPPSDQLVRLPNPNQLAHQAPYRHPHYPYGPHFQYAHGNPMRPFFAPEHEPGQQGNIGRRAHHRQSSSHVRSDGHSPSQQSYSRPLLHGPSSYGLPPLGTHDLVPYSPGNYSYFRDPYQMLPGMMPHYLGSYPHIPSPPLAGNIPSPAPAPAPAPVPSDTAKDESISRLERLILEERTEREAQQAEVRKAAAEKAAREERAAHEKKIADVAAALARADAEKKAAEQAAKAKQEAEEAAVAAAEEAEQKAAEAAAKAKKEAEEAAAAAADEAEKKAAEAAARAKKEGEEEAAAKSRLPEKKAPIKFKDAIGRKFSFPFDLCCTWQGMEGLIRQAFLHIEVIGPHVAEGHYDLVGPNGDIILPQVWETVVEPDWTVTMHMWPIPEKPKEPEPAPPPAPADVAAPAAAGAANEVPKKKPDPAGPKKKRQKPLDPGPFAWWMIGGNSRPRPNKASQKKK